MSWTVDGISLDGSQGLGLGRLETGVGMIDYAEITSVDDWGTPRLTEGDWVTVSQSGTAMLYGQVMNPSPYAGAGRAQGTVYRIVNPWHHIMNVVYKQPFKYALTWVTNETKWRSKVWLGVDTSTGAPQATNLVVADILDYCISQSGIPFSYAISGWGTLAPITEATDQMAGALILQQLRWHPNVMPHWRYTTGSATLHLKPISSATGTTIVVSNPTRPRAVVSANIKPRKDILPPVIVVKYERINEFVEPGGTVYKRIEMHEDVSGSITDQHKPGALVYTIPLQGLKAQAIEQPIRTRTVPQQISIGETVSDENMRKAVKWAQCHLAAIQGATATDMKISELVVIRDVDTSEEPSDGADAPPKAPSPFVNPAGTGTSTDPLEYYPRELLDGTIQEWMGSVKATPLVARIKIRWVGEPTTDDDVLTVFGQDLLTEFCFYVHYMGTNAITQRYRTIGSWKEAEPYPTGLAAAIAQGITTLRHEGTVVLRDQHTPVSHLPGMLATLSGGASGSGIIQRMAIDMQAGQVSLTLGFPDHLSPQDMYELMRASRANEMIATYDPKRLTTATPGGGVGAVQGTLRGAAKHVQVLNQIDDHPFRLKVIKTSTTTKLGFTPGSVHADEEDDSYDGVTLNDGALLTTIPTPTFTIIAGEYMAFLKITMLGTPESLLGDFWFIGAMKIKTVTMKVALQSEGMPDDVPLRINHETGELVEDTGIYHFPVVLWKATSTTEGMVISDLDQQMRSDQRLIANTTANLLMIPTR